MSMKKVASIAIISAIASTPALAAKDAGSGPNPFSDCGIAAAIFDNNIAAVIANVIWDIGTTAVTSALSSPETCTGKEVEAAAFIFESYDNLVVDSAHGEGEYFATLMNILAVKDADRATVISSVRQDISMAISQPSYQDKTLAELSEMYYNSVISAVSEIS
ncbi:MAG: hypothetical protein ACJA0M_000591 [Chitinophagales bacterium]|jgi:hypothetical protein